MKRVAALTLLFWLASGLGLAVQAQDVFKLPVQIIVKDGLGKPVEGASVSLQGLSALSGGDLTRRGITDDKGVASIDVRVGGPVTLKALASKASYSDKSVTLELGPADRGKTPRLEISLGKPNETILTVKVIDKKQRGLPNIKVTAAHVRPSDYFTTRDPEYSDITDADGFARLAVQTGRYTGEQTFGTELRVEAFVQNFSLSVDQRLRVAASRTVKIQYRLPSLSFNMLMLAESDSSDPVSGIPVNITVVDEKGDKVEGARVTLKTPDMNQAREKLTDDKGVTLIEATVNDVRLVDVQASKNNYKPDKQTFRLDPKMRSTGVIIETVLTLTKLTESGAEAQIKVNVTNKMDSQGVSGARVRFVALPGTPDPGFSDTTDRYGQATISSSAKGAYRLEVSQDNFITHRADVMLDRKNPSFPVVLTEIAKKKEDAKVEVFVTASDKKDAKGRPAPIPGAMVRWGNTSMGTDADGKAEIRFTGDLGVNITVEAPGYKPGVTSVDGGRYFQSSEFTRKVTLQPADASVDEPIQLTVRVLDAATRDQRVKGAKVKIQATNGVKFMIPTNDGQKDGLTTGVAGEVTFTLTQEVAKLAREGLFVEVDEANGYDGSRTEVPALMLKPSREPVVYLVQLKKTGIADALEKIREKAKDAAATEKEKKAKDAARLTIVFEVNDSMSPYAPVPGARIRLLLPDGQSLGDFTTGASGSVTAEVSAKQAAQSAYGLTMIVNADRYLERRETLPSTVLKPAPQAERYPVLLDKAGLDAQLERLKKAQKDIRDKAAEAGADEKRKADEADKVAKGDATPFKLIVETREDLAPYAPMPGVRFKLLLPGGRSLGEFTTGTDSKAAVDVRPKNAEPARQGLLTVEVKATADHGGSVTKVPASIIKPSSDPVPYLVELTSFFARDLAALNAELARLEALKNDILDKIDAAWLDRDNAESYAQAVQTQVNAKFGGKKPATPFSQIQQDANRECDLAVRTAREHVRSGEELGNEGIKLFEAAQRDAASCTSLEAASRIETSYQQALSKRDALNARSKLARQQSNDFLKKAGGLEQEAGNPLDSIRDTAKRAEEAAASAAKKVGEVRTLITELKKGHAQATGKLNTLRARKSLTQVQSGQLVEPRKRLTPLPFGLDIPDADVHARRDAVEARSKVKELESYAGSFGRQGCSDARASFPKAADTLEADLAALDFPLKSHSNLPQLAQACRQQIAKTNADQQAPAANAQVAVPDLSGLANSQMKKAVEDRGLTWLAPALVSNAPKPELSNRYIDQNPKPRTLHARGTPVQVIIWGAYKAPELPKPPVPPPPQQDPRPPAPPEAVTVPNLARHTGRAAMESALYAAGLTPAFSRPAVATPKGMQGKLSGQFPAPGARVARGSEVTFAVYPSATEEQGTPVPSAPFDPAVAAGGVPGVIGDRLEVAQAKLEAAGLHVGGISRGGRAPTPEQAGRIYSQSPGAGSPLPRNRAVALRQYDTYEAPVAQTGPGSPGSAGSPGASGSTGSPGTSGSPNAGGILGGVTPPVVTYGGSTQPDQQPTTPPGSTAQPPVYRPPDPPTTTTSRPPGVPEAIAGILGQLPGLQGNRGPVLGAPLPPRPPAAGTPAPPPPVIPTAPTPPPPGGGAAGCGIPSIAGQWANANSFTYEITQSGSTFSWRNTSRRDGVPDGGTGQFLNSTNVRGNFIMGSNQSTAEGRIFALDNKCRAKGIQWNNGLNIFRD